MPDPPRARQSSAQAQRRSVTRLQGRIVSVVVRLDDGEGDRKDVPFWRRWLSLVVGMGGKIEKGRSRGS